MRHFTKVNLLDGISGPKFTRRELGEYRPKEYHQPEEYEIQKPRAKRKGWKFLFYGFLIFLILFITFSSNVIFSSSSLLDNLTKFNSEGTFSGIWTQFKKLVTPEDKLLQGETADRTNILLLGQGGRGHEGAFLTDTIILVSLKPSTEQVATLSIPRDLYVPVAGNDWQRINYANAYGEIEKDGQGGEVASETVSNIFGVPVHYYIRVDFEGFKKVIDDLGGVTINVERSFTDPLFPNENFGTTTVTFEKGWQKMAGETALNYARSRHGDHGEAGDFARSRRQQKLILALKNKLFSFSSLLQPHKIVQALKDFNEHLTTNLETWEIIRLAKLSRKIDLEKVINKTLDDSSEGQLVPDITEAGAYVLRPKTGNFNKLANIAQYIFETEIPALAPTPEELVLDEEISTTTATTALDLIEESPDESVAPQATAAPAALPLEKIKISVLNGTWETGWAKKMADKLEALDYEIASFGNAPTHDYEKTIIYDLTEGAETQDLQFLLELFDAEIQTSLPSSLQATTGATDFLIILGLDSTNK
ncbi:LCP family protein [Patescibacteria group bacterium]|nr:LCP family protein [Patescibacteria group bacterium]MBU4511873.1 LCP family protein [Patescibacteria group bacterium]